VIHRAGTVSHQTSALKTSQPVVFHLPPHAKNKKGEKKEAQAAPKLAVTLYLCVFPASLELKTDFKYQ